MGRYSIKELECLSGIKAHTIRIWEKRYNLVSPKRTETNIRYYSDEDLVKILNVSILALSGIRISEIASFSDEQLNKAVREANNEEIRNLKRINELIISMNNLDEGRFHELYEKYTTSLGFEKTMIEVIYPYLKKVGVLWLSGEVQPIQEHWISNLIRSKIINATESIPYPSKSTKTALLFLPEGEYHEIGLLFSQFILKKSGVKVLYFGQSTPVEQVNTLLKSSKIDYAITYCLVKSKKEIEELLKLVSSNVKSEVLFIESNLQTELKLTYPEQVSAFKSFPEALAYIQ